VVVIGPNGAGKSSLLRALLGAGPPVQGRISVGSEMLLDSERGLNLPVERRGLAYVPQTYSLLPHSTVRQNIEFALGSTRARYTKAARRERLERVLSELDLVHLADRRASLLSGGEQQRTALARALSVEPRALLLDEPLAALDATSRTALRSRLARYLAEWRIPCLIVTHDAEDARVLGAHIVVLQSGRIVQSGSWSELLSRPAVPYVQQFVKASLGRVEAHGTVTGDDGISRACLT
jgi:molybdate transport system ATP-binding protein